MVRTVVAALLAAATAHAAGWQELDGAPCPEFAAGRWFNADTPPTAAALRGRVFLLAFICDT